MSVLFCVGRPRVFNRVALLNASHDIVFVYTSDEQFETILVGKRVCNLLRFVTLSIHERSLYNIIRGTVSPWKIRAETLILQCVAAGSMVSPFLTETKCYFLGSVRSSATWPFNFLFSPWAQILNVVSKDIFEVLMLFLNVSCTCFLFAPLCRQHCLLRKNKHFPKDPFVYIVQCFKNPNSFYTRFRNKIKSTGMPLIFFI